MTEIKSMQLEDGGAILIEVDDRNAGNRETRMSMGGTAANTFDKAWQSVIPVVHAMQKSVSGLTVDQAQIKFGIKIGSDLNAFVASAKAEANFEVVLTWKPARPDPQPVAGSGDEPGNPA